MPTVIDSLIIELGLDPKGFNKGQKEAAASFVKSRDEAVKVANEVEAAGRRAAEFFSRLRNEALALFAAFEAGRGLKDFISNVTNSDASVGRLSQSLGIATDVLSAWQTGAETVGGSAAGVAAAFETVNDQVQRLRFGQDAGPAIQLFKKLDVSLVDSAGHYKNAAQLIGEAFDAINKRKLSSVDAASLAKVLGADPGMIALLLKGAEARHRLLEAQRQLAPSPGDIAAAQARQAAFANLDKQITQLGRDILTDLSPAILAVMRAMQQWIAANRQWIDQAIAAEVREFAQWLRSIDWAAVGRGLKDFEGAAHSAVDAIGGVKNAVEILFGLWLGSKFVAVLANATKLATAIGGAVTGSAAALGGGAAAAGAVSGPAAAVVVPLTLKGDAADISPEQMARYRSGEASPTIFGAIWRWLFAGSGSAGLGAEGSPGMTGADFVRLYGGQSDAATFLPMGGLGPAAAASNTSYAYDNSRRSDVQINGPIIVHTAATDARGIARDLGAAIERNAFTTQSNSGAR